MCRFTCHLSYKVLKSLVYGLFFLPAWPKFCQIPPPSWFLYHLRLSNKFHNKSVSLSYLISFSYLLSHLSIYYYLNRLGAKTQIRLNAPHPELLDARASPATSWTTKYKKKETEYGTVSVALRWKYWWLPSIDAENGRYSYRRNRES